MIERRNGSFCVIDNHHDCRIVNLLLTISDFEKKTEICNYFWFHHRTCFYLFL